MPFLHNQALLVSLFVGIAGGYLHDVGTTQASSAPPAFSEQSPVNPPTRFVLPGPGGEFWSPQGSPAIAPSRRLRPCLWTPAPSVRGLESELSAAWSSESSESRSMSGVDGC